MNNSTHNPSSKYLPIRSGQNLPYVLTILLTVLMTAASVCGLLLPSSIYTTDELIQSYLTNDVVNLVIGLPALLSSIWLSRRKNLAGLLLWPGALLYVLYNYIAYIFGMPFRWVTLIYLALVLLSAYLLFALLKCIDGKAVQNKLAGVVYEKLCGWILILFGVAFTLRAIGMIAAAGMEGNLLPASEISVLIADMALSILWTAGGVMLLRRMPLGYTSGLGLLFSGSTLFIGLIIFLLLQPIFTDTPFAFTDLVVVAVMGLVCFIPFGLFMRGVLSTK